MELIDNYAPSQAVVSGDVLFHFQYRLSLNVSPTMVCLSESSTKCE